MQPLTAGLDLAGRFRLIRELGRGGFGEVWLAEDTAQSRRVALKFPAPQSLETLRASFDRARRLVHPGIVAVHEIVAGPWPFLVMQYIDGGDIGALRGAGVGTIIEALLPVAEALEYAHRQGVVHRDLKPANVLRDRQGRCFVGDFGAAAGGGTLPGMSPQQLDGEPPVAHDDVYGFGALLYELIAGVPPFHPQVTAERIRSAAPQIPTSDLTGQVLPAALQRLLESLLQKRPAQRPAGMAAVRASLEAVLDDAALQRPGAAIRPVARKRAADEAVATGPPGAALPGVRTGWPAAAVYGAGALLVLVAALVIFYLPTLVRERSAPAPAVAVRAPVPPAAAAAAGTTAVSQAELDQALGDFLRLDDELRKRNAGRWGGEQWSELRRLADQSDAAYRNRDVVAALGGYRAAAGAAQALLDHAPEVLAQALRAGEAGLAAGDQTRAIAAFETALAVAPDHREAAQGLSRARNLDKLQALLHEASLAEANGQKERALAVYRQAAALDPAARAAAEAVTRLEAAAARDAFQAQMARGYAAQAQGELGAAREAFAAALRLRPGEAQATAALAQVESDRQLQRLAALQSEATGFEQQERWADAAGRYEAALALDPNLADARRALDHARARAALAEQLQGEIGNAEYFNDDTRLARARAVLDRARAVTAPGPVLSQQTAELERLVELAVIPVDVTFESDNLTEVTLFKVGRLGTFANRNMALRPGLYTAVGSRSGFRDVRRSFRVVAGETGTRVVVRCEEPI